MAYKAANGGKGDDVKGRLKTMAFCLEMSKRKSLAGMKASHPHTIAFVDSGGNYGV